MIILLNYEKMRFGKHEIGSHITNFRRKIYISFCRTHLSSTKYGQQRKNNTDGEVNKNHDSVNANEEEDDSAKTQNHEQDTQRA